MQQHYQDRLNALHKFLYCELPLRMMESEDSLNLQDRLYNLIETGYIQQNEITIRQLVDDNQELECSVEQLESQLSQQLIQQSLIQAQYASQQQGLQSQISELTQEYTQLQNQYDELDQQSQEYKNKLQGYDELSTQYQELQVRDNNLTDKLRMAQVQLQELTQEYIRLQEENANNIQLNDELEQQLKQLQVILQSHQESNNEVCERLDTLAQEAQSQMSQLEQEKDKLLVENTQLKVQISELPVSGLLIEQLNCLRIELQGMQAEVKINYQIMEQLKTQLTGDLCQGIYSIISRVRLECQDECIQMSKQFNQQKEELSGQIVKLKKDLQFYKVLEGEYENKLAESISQAGEARQLAHCKGQQLQDIQNKLEQIQQNILQQDQFNQEQLNELQDRNEKLAQSRQQFKNIVKLRLCNALKQLELLREQQSKVNINIQNKLQGLGNELRDEYSGTIDGLTLELKQSIETIKKQYNQIQQMEVEHKQEKMRLIIENSQRKDNQIQQPLPQPLEVQQQPIQQYQSKHSIQPIYNKGYGLDENRQQLNQLKSIVSTTRSMSRRHKK